MQLPAHGSNPQQLYNALGVAMPRDYIDFSVNTNPLGTPEEVKQSWPNWLEEVYDYPDPLGTDLKRIVAKKEGVDASRLVLGNGAAELITLLARYLRQKRVLIIQPAFSEYETACRSEGCSITYYVAMPPDWQLDRKVLEEKLPQVDAVFICQPNNPTGVSYQPAVLDWLIEYCHQGKTLLIIDEAFYDFAVEPVTAIQRATNSPSILVLRSLTKMYNIAGLRLGYLVGQPGLLEEIASFQPHWSVNAIAMKAGQVCLADEVHPSKTRIYIEAERKRLFSFFKEHHFIHSPSTINFYIFSDPTAASIKDLFIFLLAKGLVVRHTNNFPGLSSQWLRAAIKTRAENNLLMGALKEWRQHV